MSDKNFNMVGGSEPGCVLDVLNRAAQSAAAEDDRWLSADEIADSLNDAGTDLVRRECLRLLGEGRILVRTFRRGLSQRVPRFRVVVGDKGGDIHSGASDPIADVSPPRNNPPHRLRRYSKSLGVGRKNKDG